MPVMGALGGSLPVQEDMQDHRAVLQLAAAMKEEIFFKGFVDFYFDKGFDAHRLKSKHTRAIIQFGLPLEGYKSKGDRSKEQDEKLSSWFRQSFRSFLEDTSQAGEVEVLYFASPFFFDEFIGILLRDMLLALVAVAFVFCCLWAHSGSLFLATAGMMEILLTIPVAFVLAGKVECPLFDFKAWLESRGKTFPVPAAEVGSAMEEFLKAQVKGAFDASQTYEQKWQNAIGYSDSLEQVRFMTVSVESTLPER